jgi:pyrroline-5-carboxylate reductase
MTTENQYQPTPLNICFIGGGNMARALISGMLQQGFDACRINVIESDAEKRKQLKNDFSINTTEQLPSAAASDIIVLAVKPQQLRDLSIFLGSLLKNQLIISIAAGVRSRDLARWLGGYEAIVRVMPNTPAQIQAGVSALFAATDVTPLQKQQAESLMKAVGATLWLDNEARMDAVTAISGSGPAYVFYLIEALQEAAIALGFTTEEAKMLSLQTFSGATRLAMQSNENPETLRHQVTSKGGTTERAIQSLDAAGVKAAISAAANAAAERSRELGDQLGAE